MKNSSFVSPLSFWTQAVSAANSEVTLTGAIKAYHRGDYLHAMPSLSDLADEGNAKAQHYLAEMYANGQGTERDPDAAMCWYVESAHGGCAESQARLGQLYASGGPGVVPDPSMAYAWLDIAAASGESSAAVARDLTARQMSSHQLKHGRSLSIKLAARGSR